MRDQVDEGRKESRVVVLAWRDRSSDQSSQPSSEVGGKEKRGAPLELNVGTSRARCDLEVVTVLAEEVVRRKKLAPRCGADDDPVDDFGSCERGKKSVGCKSAERTLRTSLELGSHDALSAESYVVGGAHGGVGGSDDGHAVRAVGGVQLLSVLVQSREGPATKTCLGIPDANLERTFLDRSQEHGLRPLPLKHDEEEAKLHVSVLLDPRSGRRTER